MAAKKTVTRLEKADRHASDAVNGERDSLPMRLIGAVSDVGDQPQMRLLCAATILAGAVRRDGRLTATGVKMLVAHTLATWAKGRVKAVINRTRPETGDDPKVRLGDSDAHEQNSFPSGHSAGAVAVAEAVARSYPKHSGGARLAASLVAGIQIPRGTHYLGDALVGSFIGVLAERVMNLALTVGTAHMRSRVLRAIYPPRSKEFDMLEHVPAWLGNLLRDQRAGHGKLVAADASLSLGAQTIELSSTAFAVGARLPVRSTADGEGVSPPLLSSTLPEGTASLALIVEDPDTPTPNPLVHAILWGMSPAEGSLAEGAIVPDGACGANGDVGRNSYLREGWLPPDPPTGHGKHDYVFQLFALSEHPQLDANPGRGAFVAAISGIVLATGVLVGTYSREEPTAGSPRVPFLA